MTSQITIIGLGKTGTAMGLALKEEASRITRLGYDLERETAQQALRLGAVDQVRLNLHNAVEGSSGVLLCLPPDQILPVLQQIAPDLRPGAVVMDTAPLKSAVSDWAQTSLPPGVSYVGLLPLLNLEAAPPAATQGDPPPASADLLYAATIYIAAPPGTPAAAVQFAADLVSLMNAAPIFTDIAELDGLAAKTQILPALAAAGLLHASALQPGWREGRKIASLPFAAATLPLNLASPAALQTLFTANPAETLRVLDAFIASLHDLRAEVCAPTATAPQSPLANLLHRAAVERQIWWQQRLSNDWDTTPTLTEKPDLLSRLFGFGSKKRKKA